MKKLVLKNVTLLGVDCVNVERLGRAMKICTDQIKFGNVVLLSSLESKDYKVTKIKPLKDIHSYSKFMIRQLDRFVKTDYVLIVQHDGFVLNPSAWSKEFLCHDYIGAPWWYTDGKNVGNGGFSLRSKKLLKILAKDKHIRKYSPEDHHICRTYRRYLEIKGISYAPEYLAAQFSVEGNIKQFMNGQNTWKGSFGFHDLKKTVITEWLKTHPQYRFIVNVIKESYRL